MFELLVDNDAIRLSSTRGWSAALLQCSRCYGCSVQWMHDRLEQNIMRISRVDGSVNYADAMTKILAHAGALGRFLTTPTGTDLKTIAKMVSAGAWVDVKRSSAVEAYRAHEAERGVKIVGGVSPH